MRCSLPAALHRPPSVPLRGVVFVTGLLLLELICSLALQSSSKLCAWGRLVADGVRVMARQCHVTSSLRHLARLPDSRVPPPRSSAFWQSQLSASEERSSPCHRAETASNALSLLPHRQETRRSVGLPSARGHGNLPPRQKPRNRPGSDVPLPVWTTPTCCITA